MAESKDPPRAVAGTVVGKDDPDKIVKVKMNEAAFDPDHGKMEADRVYEFPMERAQRFVKLGLAKPAPAGARTARDEDNAAKLRDFKTRAKQQDLENEMAAAWDVDVRSLEAHQFEAEAAATDAEEKKALAERGAARAKAGIQPAAVNVRTDGDD